jgi:hypothetical protein
MHRKVHNTFIVLFTSAVVLVTGTANANASLDVNRAGDRHQYVAGADGTLSWSVKDRAADSRAGRRHLGRRHLGRRHLGRITSDRH